jgi:hypothetical protein
MHARFTFLHNGKFYVYIRYMMALGWLIFVETHHLSVINQLDSVHCVTEFVVYFH